MLKIIKKIPAWVLWVMPLVLMGIGIYLSTIQHFGACCVLFFLLGVFGTMLWVKDEADKLP